MTKPLVTTHAMFIRDAKRIADFAAEVEKQVGFYLRNGRGDELRFMLILIEGHRLKKAAQLANRRLEQLREGGKQKADP